MFSSLCLSQNLQNLTVDTNSWAIDYMNLFIQQIFIDCHCEPIEVIRKAKSWSLESCMNKLWIDVWIMMYVFFNHSENNLKWDVQFKNIDLAGLKK